MNNTFGTHVRETRRKAGLSQRALAERVGVHQPAIARIEAGTRHAGPTVARALCTALGLGHPWPATAFIEAYASSQQAKFGVSPQQTIREIRDALAAHGNRGYLVFDADVAPELDAACESEAA